MSIEKGFAMLDPRQRKLYDAWRHEAQARGTIPPRETFDPIDFPQALSTLCLAEIAEDRRVRIRLWGTDLLEAWGRDMSGRYLDEFTQGPYHDFILGLVDECIDKRTAIYSNSRFQWDRGRQVDTRRLMLPYASHSDSTVVNLILLSQVFDYGKAGPDQPIISALDEAQVVELERVHLDWAIRGGDS